MSHNTWIHRLVEYAVEPLVRTPLRPNHITVMRLSTGITAAIVFAWGYREAEIWASAIFLLSMLLDRADGVLARLQGTASRSGHVFDLVADALSTTLVFVGIGIGLRSSWLGPWTVLLGLAAGIAIAAAFWMSARLESRASVPALGIGSAGGFDPDDAMLAVPIAMACGFGVYLVIAAATLAPVFALAMLAVRWKALRSAPRPSGEPGRSSIGNKSRRRVRQL